MKKKSLFTAFTAAAVALSACGQAGGKGKQLTMDSNQDSLATQKAGIQVDGKAEKEVLLSVKTYRDSLIKEMGNIHISIDFPEEGNQTLVDSIRKWMLHSISSNATGIPNNAKTLTKAYIESCTAELGETEEYVGEDSNMPLYEYDLTISKIYESEKFVTFKQNNYVYMGGAHGLSGMGGTTFRKSDGRIFGNNMLNMGEQKEIRKLIENKLLPYFEVKTTAELRDILFLPEGETLVPMPGTEPYIDKGDMVFIYQQYEIAPYAAGMPEARIPIKELMPYLSESFKNAYFQ